MAGVSLHVGNASPATSWTQIGEDTQTTGNLSRTVVDIDWGSVQSVSDPREWGFTILSEYSGSNAERFIHDEIWDDLPALLGTGEPFVMGVPHPMGYGVLVNTGTPIDYRVDRTDSGGSTTSRILTSYISEYPTVYTPEMMYVAASHAWALSTVRFIAPFPLWRDREEQTVDTVSVTNNDATSTNNVAWGTYANGGYAPCGLSATVSAISGTLTSLTVACTDFGESLTWSDGTALANNDVVNWRVTDPQNYTLTDGNTINASGELGLARGDNDGTIVGAGSSSPACTVTLKTRRFWKGP